jgi:hypothetical protein
MAAELRAHHAGDMRLVPDGLARRQVALEKQRQTILEITTDTRETPTPRPAKRAVTQSRKLRAGNGTVREICPHNHLLSLSHARVRHGNPASFPPSPSLSITEAWGGLSVTIVSSSWGVEALWCGRFDVGDMAPMESGGCWPIGVEGCRPSRLDQRKRRVARRVVVRVFRPTPLGGRLSRRGCRRGRLTAHWRRCHLPARRVARGPPREPKPPGGRRVAPAGTR